MARIALSHGDLVAARAASARAVDLISRVRDVFDIRTQPQVWLVRSAVLLKDGNATEARQFAERAHDASVRFDAASSPTIMLTTAAVRRAAAMEGAT